MMGIGDIIEVGEGVEGLKVGDKVFGSSSTGAYAEKIVVDAGAVHVLPEVLSSFIFIFHLSFSHFAFSFSSFIVFAISNYYSFSFS